LPRCGLDLFSQTIDAIGPPDESAAAAAARRLDSLTKPRGSLGYLEEIVRRYAAIRHDPAATFGRGAILVFVADHGVADAGVSAYPKSVTAEMLRNFAHGGAAISVLARHLGLDLRVIDVGVETDTRRENLPGVIYRRIAPGTANFILEPAMTRAQMHDALEVGINAATEATGAGATLIGIGEMGIANSTSAAAILCAITGIEAARMAGRGTGLDDHGMRRKIAAIESALALHRDALANPETMLAALGGFEIAAMAGACLGAAAHRTPAVIDGYIATAAAAVACRLAPRVRDYLFFSHRSAEGGHALALDHLGARPILDLDLRLGEGTGAALAMATIGAALALFHGMATFGEAGISEKIE
jgi:nicotinate-nucleotide--dimethylbenzimidazole phosphoribosyltransferase